MPATDARRRTVRRAALLLGALLVGPGAVQWCWLSWRSFRLGRVEERLAASRQQLAREHQRLQDDPVYVEGLIRSTFKFAKPGEMVVPMEPSQPKRPPSSL